MFFGKFYQDYLVQKSIFHDFILLAKCSNGLNSGPHTAWQIWFEFKHSIQLSLHFGFRYQSHCQSNRFFCGATARICSRLPLVQVSKSHTHSRTPPERVISSSKRPLPLQPTTQTAMAWAGSESAILAIELPQSYALDRTATGNGSLTNTKFYYIFPRVNVFFFKVSLS